MPHARMHARTHAHLHTCSIGLRVVTLGKTYCLVAGMCIGGFALINIAVHYTLSDLVCTIATAPCHYAAMHATIPRPMFCQHRSPPRPCCRRGCYIWRIYIWQIYIRQVYIWQVDIWQVYIWQIYIWQVGIRHIYIRQIYIWLVDIWQIYIWQIEAERRDTYVYQDLHPEPKAELKELYCCGCDLKVGLLIVIKVFACGCPPYLAMGYTTPR